jgi:hypothetical protein
MTDFFIIDACTGGLAAMVEKQAVSIIYCTK